ncbi:TetR family transcriptional regulator [Sphingobium sp. WTD-1]|uniref:TetR/AcrR family transcriptional regulator n=1 Tax=Sphingobium yanoikuyae TaxID=13690 RepID=A0A430BD45_SPHYA|nr:MULTISPECIES: TetR/AcrR family transcriptional regulator [Sphingobium]RSU46629.1 TetR/AcrR family transcriptional regulator [Sphingobium yanoikuyae]WIA57126.1 TetR family transcriptional regulator [Sphingobium sp. WTD-1]
MDRAAPGVRRTQEERTAQTRLALIEATIASIGDHGYTGASTTLIAQRAGVSRGAMLHHFATRAALMAQVVRHVFNSEMAEYEATRVRTGMGDNLFDWPSLLWSVLSRPPGMAVLEILQATRSDPELAELVVPMQEEVEHSALTVMRGAFGGDEALARTVMRLMVWSVRGLSIADRYLPHRAETEHAILLLGEMMRLAVPDGRMEKMRALIEGKTKG